MSTPPSDDAHRDRIQGLIGPDYRLQWVIGHGGMSTVWLADDVAHDREVAIKALRPEFSNNTEFLERFRNEAEAAEHIDSDNVVRTFDYREVPDPTGTVFCFIVMEYVRGESLADLLAREGSLSEDMALDVMEQAAHGLAVIHSMGLVHRDIKPGNLLVTQAGQVKITDFGIAKAAAAVPLTRTGMVVGTAQYVSPEQAQGQEVYATSDVYSLGVVGYEILSGRRPFTGDSSVSVVLAHINQAPPQLPTAVTAQTRELIGITLRKDPNTRYADGSELANAISRVRLGARPPQPRTAAVAGPAPEPSPTSATALLGQVANPPVAGAAAGAGAAGAAALAGAGAGAGAGDAQAAEAAQAAQAAQGAQAAAPGAGAAGAAGGAGSRTGSGAAGTGSKDQKKGGFGVGLAIAAAIAVLGAVGYGLYSMDFFGSGDSAASTTPTPTEPAIVTQYVTETQATTIVETAHSNPDDAAVDEGDGDEAGDPAEPASQRRNDAARDKDKDNPARSTAHARAHGDTARTGAGNNDANSGDTNPARGGDQPAGADHGAGQGAGTAGHGGAEDAAGALVSGAADAIDNLTDGGR
ncbi:serine/threonine-protein kinase [Corynebacterium uberis]|uniref:serine/threonine-protein kinase n=2 Tax=Corynebacteriaceae TaxID=1653 RepID=UPI001D09ADE8|nr:serine/threonine-protein kinase [Corynebacterium uberis]MCZ9310123.1 serine/threonine protein kinase [Corynebacterium sp. c6VSa_13]UDL74781.1 serine/threonine protein kinase [Corynebacterium uberis]UDL77030.1 serine/threonine protein kinase [Corynebacterium uberis]UDL79241.1 serine/threonine protein kinase [Corynebacterium uberis]UDL81446.1 serine/threonine protein kinase [Corynebacterium uberis]